MAEAAGNPWQTAEEGWAELIAAARKIQGAADEIKKSERSIDGYNIERSLNKHKPDLMKQHYDGLKEHRKSNSL
ncbi:MAG TPA: hypothetical protein VKX17_00180 [Planctomycetota bacterium]|nr:hypothetical protein [Planctomycetota bacterium]